MRHAYVISETIKEVQGMPNVRDHDFSTYFRIQGQSQSSQYGTQIERDLVTVTYFSLRNRRKHLHGRIREQPDFVRQRCE